MSAERGRCLAACEQWKQKHGELSHEIKTAAHIQEALEATVKRLQRELQLLQKQRGTVQAQVKQKQAMLVKAQEQPQHGEKQGGLGCAEVRVHGAIAMRRVKSQWRALSVRRCVAGWAEQVQAGKLRLLKGIMAMRQMTPTEQTRLQGARAMWRATARWATSAVLQCIVGWRVGMLGQRKLASQDIAGTWGLQVKEKQKQKMYHQGTVAMSRVIARWLQDHVGMCIAEWAHHVHGGKMRKRGMVAMSRVIMRWIGDVVRMCVITIFDNTQKYKQHHAAMAKHLNTHKYAATAMRRVIARWTKDCLSRCVTEWASLGQGHRLPPLAVAIQHAPDSVDTVQVKSHAAIREDTGIHHRLFELCTVPISHMVICDVCDGDIQAGTLEAIVTFPGQTCAPRVAKRSCLNCTASIVWQGVRKTMQTQHSERHVGSPGLEASSQVPLDW